MTVATDHSRTRPAGAALRVVPGVRRRHTPWIVAGILLVAGCAFAAGQLYLRSTGLRPVLALARDVPAGHVLQAGDVRVVDAAADGGVALLSQGNESNVLGQPVSHDLVAGGLLTRGDIAPASAVTGNQAIVAIACKQGQYPPALVAGDRVTVVDTGTTGALGGAIAPQVIATVLSVDQQQGPAADGAVVSLRLSAADAPSVASTGAAGHVALVLLAPGP